MPKSSVQVFFIVTVLLASACSVPVDDKKKGAPAPVSDQPTIVPTPTPVPTPPSSAVSQIDAVKSETVTTSSGHKFKGAFEELAEKQTTSSGHVFQGVFYE